MSASEDYMNTVFQDRYALEIGRDSRESALEAFDACAPRDHIDLAVPTPGSFLAGVQELIARYKPESPDVRPALTGTRESLNALFENHAIALGARDRVVKLHYASAEHWLARWKLSYAPLQRAYQLVDPEWRDQFSDDLVRLAKQFTKVDADGRYIHCQYLEFLVHKGPMQ